MSIYDNVSEFAGLPVVDFDPQAGILTPQTIAYRLRLDYDDISKGATIIDLLNRYLDDPAVEKVTAIVIGAWTDDMDHDARPIVETLAAAADKLPNLRALFIGDITYEEWEISWIEQTDVSPLLAAFPQLEHFRVRGGFGLSLGELNHQNLKSLIVETGGLSVSVVRQVAVANLPALEHLELWLGMENYGGDSTIEDVNPILAENKFPKLRYLGLCDSEYQDEVAIAVARSPLVKQLEILDLSKGTLSDEGAEALLNSPYIKTLKKLDIHHHYVSDELVANLRGIGFEVDASKGHEGDEDDRYVAVGE
jgi:hypothetical protein